MQKENKIKSVCVLMSAYNGEKYIEEQIISLLNQINVNINIFVRDDGSSDDTITILEKYNGKNLKWFAGNHIGPARSFMELVYNAPIADYYAFCDQDDIWQTNKLYEAVNKLRNNINSGKGSYYFSNVFIVEKNLENIRKSIIDRNQMNLKQCLMHNVAIGCTVVFDNILREKVIMYRPDYVYMHDWWLYLICLSSGGTIIFDEEAYILYRQHGNNALGFKAVKRSLKEKIFLPTEREPSKTARELLKGYGHLMDEKSYQAVYILANYSVCLKYKLKLLFDNSYFQGSVKNRIFEKIAVLRNRK